MQSFTNFKDEFFYQASLSLDSHLGEESPTWALYRNLIYRHVQMYRKLKVSEKWKLILFTKIKDPGIRKWVVALFILLNSVFPHYQDMELSYPLYSAPYDQSILSSLRAPTCLLLRHRIEKNKKTAEAVWSKSVF